MVFSLFFTWDYREGEKESDKQTGKVLLPDASIQGQVLGTAFPPVIACSSTSGEGCALEY